jgi:hypothetical protein
MPRTLPKGMFRYIVGFAALAVVTATCSDLTAPEGLNGPVSISYQGPPAPSGGVIQLIVGQRVAPVFRVDLGGVPQSRARYVLSLPNLADTNVLRILGNGDSVEVLGRGNATLEATLVGVTVGIALATRASVNVIATPASNTVDSTSLTFNSLGIAKQLTGSSLKQDGSSIPLQSTSLVWSSADPVIAGVTKLTDSTAIVTSLGNGTTTITATFDGIDVVTVPVTVSQAFARFQLATATFGTGEVTLVSLGETITATASPLDANGQNLLAGSQPAPTPSFASTVSGRASVSPVSGQITAIDNTDPIAPARIYATAAGVPRSDSLSVVVRQRATSIVISGLRVDSISSLGATKNFTAVARDANNRDLPPSFITWTSTDQTIAQVNAGPPVVVTAIGVGTTRLAAARPSDNVGDTITLVVSNNPASIELLPASLSILSLDDTVRFASAQVRNTKGDVLTASPVTWTSLNPAVVEAVPDGRMVSKAIGTTSVVATTSNGIADTSQVVVTNAPEVLDIIPTNVSLASSGDTIAVAVDFRNSRGVSLPSSSASWSSADVSVARVAADGSGRIIATGSGDTYVLAVSPVNPARRDSVLVNVTNAPAAIATSPSSAQTLTAFGQTLQFSATVFNAAGNPIPSAPVRWTVPAGAAFISIDSISGLVTAVANGAATVRARSGTVTADVSVTVAQAFSPARSTIIPTAGTIAADGVENTTITVQLRDANNNNLVSTTATPVLSTSRGTLGTVTNQGGGTYTAVLTSSTASGNAVVSATVSAVAITNSALVTFTPGAATQYILVVLPNTSPIVGAQVTISAQLADQFGNPVTNQVRTVTWSSTNGGTFSQPTTLTSNGRASVSFTTSTTPNTVHTVTATDNSAPPLTGASPAITTASGGPTNYLVTSSNANPIAGTAVTITARLRDATNNFVRTAGRRVNWSSTNGGSFSAAFSFTDGDGIAVVSFTTSASDNIAHTVTATDNAAPALNGTSATFTTVVPTQYIVTAPATATAGTPIIITAQLAGVLNNSANLAGQTVAWNVSLGTGGSFSTPTSQTDANGRAVVAFTATATGNYRVRATDNTALTGESGIIAVAAGPLANFLVESSGGGAIAAQTAGTPFNVRITARDANNNTVTAFTGTVDLSGVAGTTVQGQPVVSAAFTAGVLASHSVTVTSAGTAKSLIVTNSAGAQTGTSNTFDVNGGAPATFTVAGSGTQVAGTSQVVTITAFDTFGNIATYSGAQNVTFSGATPSGGFNPTATNNAAAPVAFGTATAVNFANGVATSSVVLYKAETAAIAVSAGVANTPAPLSVTVGAAALDHFLVTAAGGGNIPTPVADGTVIALDITAQDLYDNTQTTFTGTVNFTVTNQVAINPVVSSAFSGGTNLGFNVTVTNTDPGGFLGIPPPQPQSTRIRARNSAGAQFGDSNNFTVNP